jgi:toxin YoeB
MLEVVFVKGAEEDYQFFAKTNPTLKTRVDLLVQAIQASPFQGIGKPEPLKFDLSGYWSRRINKEHRLVYKIVENTLYIVQCRYHY